mmetsp:Transcript_9322/g.26759  ORF Transcript_9322/g.26759 Transcript_9322/m.26759 type:complete len:135 (+) Transcript_9322:1099-1503(+)
MFPRRNLWSYTNLQWRKSDVPTHRVVWPGLFLAGCLSAVTRENLHHYNKVRDLLDVAASNSRETLIPRFRAASALARLEVFSNYINVSFFLQGNTSTETKHLLSLLINTQKHHSGTTILQCVIVQRLAQSCIPR